MDKYQIITIPEGTLIVKKLTAENIKYPAVVLEKLTTGKYELFQNDDPNDVDLNHQYEIIAANVHLSVDKHYFLNEENLKKIPRFEAAHIPRHITNKYYELRPCSLRRFYNKLLVTLLSN